VLLVCSKYTEIYPCVVYECFGFSHYLGNGRVLRKNNLFLQIGFVVSNYLTLASWSVA